MERRNLVFIVDTMGEAKKKRIAMAIAGAAGETRADNETWCESAVYFHRMNAGLQ